MQLDFFTRFKSQHLVEVGLMSFSNLKPYIVKKQKDFNTCCKYHQIMIEIKVGFCNMHALIIRNGDDSRCSCGCKIICNLLCIALVGKRSINYQISQHTSKENLELREKTYYPQCEGNSLKKMKCIWGEWITLWFPKIAITCSFTNIYHS